MRERWVDLWCHGCLWRGAACGGCSSGLLWWCLGGLWTEMGGLCGARRRLVDLWVMHNIVMDGTQHVFPGSGVGELFRVC